MTKWYVACLGLLLLSSCCAELRNKVHAYGLAVEDQTESGKVLLSKCQNGDAAACTAVGNTLSSIGKSARTLQQ